MAPPTQLVDHELRHAPDWRPEGGTAQTPSSHPEEDNCGSCVADDLSLISCADLDALISVSIGSNHHPIPKFLSKSASKQPSPVPTVAMELLPGPTYYDSASPDTFHPCIVTSYPRELNPAPPQPSPPPPNRSLDQMHPHSKEPPDPFPMP